VVLNKLKKLFMKKEEKEVTSMADVPEEAFGKEDILEDYQQPTVESEPDTNVSVVDGATEIIATKSELEQITDPASSDPDYLEYSAEAVGYQDRQSQWDMYRTISTYIQPDEEGDMSIIDFGCGRGDFERFYKTEFPGTDIDYVGIDFNRQIVNAGNSAYDNEVDIKCTDWFNLPEDLKEDWAININSNNLRYDADTTKSDTEYLHATIDSMYKHADKGIIIMLATGQTPDGLINYEPAPLLDWAIKKYRIVTLDHSLGEDLFTLIIYKN